MINRKTVFEKNRVYTETFRRLLESLPDPVICQGPGCLNIAMVNGAAAKLFGYEKSEMLGRSAESLYINKTDFLHLQKMSTPAGSLTVPAPFKAIMKRKDGKTFHAEIIATTLKSDDEAGDVHLTLIHDISEQKELKDQLEDLQNKFKAVADFTYDWECLMQLDGTFQYISPSCLRITGYSAEQFMADPSLFEHIIHPEDQAAWDHHHDESMAKTIHPREIQFRIIRADGEIRWIEHVCQPVFDELQEMKGFRSSNRDITKRKQYEQELTHALAEIEQYKERLEAESHYLRVELSASNNYDSIIGESNAIKEVFFKIEQVSSSDTTVLLLGESGTGKELFARAIHNDSPRKDRPIIKVNCAAISPELIETELFGHEKGAFSGAVRRHIGRFGLADNGTIFLDEIGEIPPNLQGKLLRVLQEGEFEMVGSSTTTKVNARIIAATNRDLAQDVRDGLFRKDLWYRLSVFPITLPTLRDRSEDIPLLVHHFVKAISRKRGKKISSIPAMTMQRLINYPWPGNIRELQNVIERAVLNTPGSCLILADQLQPPPWSPTKNIPTLAEIEREHILKVLEQTGWKTSGKNSAAEILGMKRSTLRAKINKYQIHKP